MENIFRDLTVSASQTGQEEEAIRLQVRELPDGKRKAYYEQIEPRLRDPDTYAVLNWLFVGVHHLYLGRWLRGLANITLIFIALLLIFASSNVAAFFLGCAIIFAIAVVELVQLFRSQTIVADYNNQQARHVLRRIS